MLALHACLLCLFAGIFDTSIATNIAQQESSARPYFFLQVITTLHHSSAHCTHLTFIVASYMFSKIITQSSELHS